MDRLSLWKSQLEDWRAFDERQAGAYADFQRALPPSTAKPHFRLARAVLEHVRAEAVAGVGLARPPMRALDYFDSSREAGRALALDDAAWGWDPRAVELRERAFEAKESEAQALAREMAEVPGPPWILWACASRAPGALLAALFERGVRHRAGLPLGSMGLAAAMGFSGLPASSWIAAVARASAPSGFCADSAPVGNFYFLQDLLSRRPEAFPDLPIRQGCGDAYSRALDAMDACSAPPASAIVLSALGLAHYPERPPEPETLGPLLETPYLLSTLSARMGGLPAGFERRWPMLKAFGFSRSKPHEVVDSIRRLAALGADARDLFERREVWEHQVEPCSEQGSEGDFAPIDQPLLGLLFDLGADFLSTRLGRAWAAERSQPKLDRDMSLAEFYRATLDAPRADQACDELAPWIAACQARAEAREMDEALPAAPRSGPRSL